MGVLAVIGGHSILGVDFPAGAERRSIDTSHGEMTLLDAGEVIGVQRHGTDDYRTAPQINHRANLAALSELGCDRVLAVGSTGGLRVELAVGTFVCPDDFIALHLGTSYSHGHGGERVPGFDPDWREQVLRAWQSTTDIPIRPGGTYWQAIGPRFETPAEIRMISAHADVIGMTIAAECILAGELGIRYAAVCVVDNLANGVGAAPLTLQEFEAGKERNRHRLLEALAAVVPELTSGP